jgi:hypothetical protein
METFRCVVNPKHVVDYVHSPTLRPLHAHTLTLP